jgi:MFS family permease
VLAALSASGAADGFGPVTLSFAVLRATGSAGRLGLVLAVQAAAALLLTLAGGVAADRFSRGLILTCSLVARAGGAALLAATMLTGTASFPLLLAVAGAYGCADGFFGPASIALLPDLVPRDRLARANALLGGAGSTAAIAAPALAGLIVAALGPGAGFAVQAALLAAAAGSLRGGALAAAAGSLRGGAPQVTKVTKVTQVAVGHRRAEVKRVVRPPGSRAAGAARGHEAAGAARGHEAAGW